MQDLIRQVLQAHTKKETSSAYSNSRGTSARQQQSLLKAQKNLRLQIGSSMSAKQLSQSFMSEDGGSVVYPTNKDAMLIGNWSCLESKGNNGSTTESGYDAAYPSSYTCTSQRISRNFVFTGSNVPLKTSSSSNTSKSFQTLSFSMNQPTATQNQFYKRKNRRKLQSRERSTSTERSATSHRRQFVRISGTRIPYGTVTQNDQSMQPSQQQPRVQTASSQNKRRRLVHHGVLTVSGGVLRPTALQPTSGSDQQSNRYVTSGPSYDALNQLRDLRDGVVVDSNGMTNNQVSTVQQKPAGGDITSSPAHEIKAKVELFRTDSVYTDGHFGGGGGGGPSCEGGNNANANEVCTDEENQSQEVEGGVAVANGVGESRSGTKLLGPSTGLSMQCDQHALIQRNFEQMHEATQGSMSNLSNTQSMQHSQRLAPRISLAGGFIDVDKSGSFHQDESTLREDIYQRSDRHRQKSNRQSPTTSASAAAAAVGKRATSVSRRTTLQKGASQMYQQRQVVHMSDSISNVASSMARELDLDLSEDEVASQANWLAQASLSIAIVKKQIAVPQSEEQVAPDTRQKYITYLKKLLDDASRDM